MNEILIVLLAYLIGSIPSAVWVSKYLFNFDIRDYGSGNAGATNTFRVLGPKWGTIVMIADILKGFIAVKLAYLLPNYLPYDNLFETLQLSLGMAAVLGHIFPIWADLKGGKGVATLFGIVLGISPITAVSCVGVFILVLYLTRFVSLSSILASIAFPIFILGIFNSENLAYRLFAVGVALMVLLTHQKNISRIFKGNESKVPASKLRPKLRNTKNV